jgi:tripeptide aminopeptidase
VPATKTGTPLFLCAHLDTVAVDGLLEPSLGEDGVVRNAGGAILGSDNKAAVVVMLEAVRRILDEGLPHAGVELLFTQSEEIGLLGAYAFDCARLQARTGYVFDQAAPLGEVILGAPAACAIEARFHGRAAHAGMHAEDGRSAILAASRAIADLRLGQLDDRTTANVGSIHGGIARNIVPEWCTVVAEARSRDEATLSAVVQEMLDAFAFAASTSDCTVETTVARQYRAYELRRSDPVVRIAEDGLRRAGFEPTFAYSGGAADANVFNERGLSCANLANGMTDIHTPDEHIAVADLDRMVDVTLGLVAAATEVDGS